MSIYTDVPLLPWEYVLAAILSMSILWLVLRATRKAERRRAATLRSHIPSEQAAGNPPQTPLSAQSRPKSPTAPAPKDDR